MSGSTMGRMFRITTFGESHGGGLGVVIDGCPPKLSLDAADIQPDLDRRRPGTSKLSSARREADGVEVLSGVFEGQTTGTPIAMLLRNTDAKPGAYAHLKDLYRPSHADYTYDAKYGHRAWAGGGRASARETAARVAAGAVARKLLREQCGVEIVAWVESVADVQAAIDTPHDITREDVARNGDVQCPDPLAAKAMTALIGEVRKDGDTVGGVIRCIASGLPAGWGNPVFEKLDAALASAMVGLPAAKGFEIGSGFGGTALRGSTHNDAFVSEGGRILTETNRSGGVQGGISNGMPVDLRVAFKPVATHFKAQQTVTTAGEPTTFQASGRHDPCVLPRAVVIVEAMTAVVLADAWLVHRGQTGML
jgi:chorismate synthase